MMRRENGRVLIDISEHEYESLLMVLGFATGCAHSVAGVITGRGILRLANTINEGNPDWTPYRVDEPQEAGR